MVAVLSDEGEYKRDRSQKILLHSNMSNRKVIHLPSWQKQG